MSSLIDRFYPLPDVRRTPLSLLGWWESRRPLYNGIVGATGLVTLSGIAVLSALLPGSESLPLSVAVGAAVVYGIAANVCYSMGWGVEMLASWVWGREAPKLGPLLFRQGLIFSVGLTLLPLIVFFFATVLQVVLWVVGAGS